MLIFAVTMALAWAQDRSPQDIIADIEPRQEAYRQCLTDKTVELGKGNSESAETILRAVSAACLPVEMNLRSLYAETPLPTARVEMLMKRDRKLGEDAGVAALLEARAAARD